MRIGVVGLGYVGFPLAVAFAEEGHDVVGVDTDQRKLAPWPRGAATSRTSAPDRVAAALERLRVTARYADLASCEAVIIAVPTPLTRNREPDLGAARGRGDRACQRASGGPAGGARVHHLSRHHAGAARAPARGVGARGRPRLQPRLLPGAHRPGQHRLHAAQHAEGRRRAHRRPASSARSTLYEHVCDEVVPVSTPEAAELTKLLENIFRSVNIALVNELAMLCDSMEIDVWEVVEAAATKPYGFMSFTPGPGVGGHCLPGRPLLPGVERAGVRPAHGVHRAGG